MPNLVRYDNRHKREPIMALSFNLPSLLELIKMANDGTIIRLSRTFGAATWPHRLVV
jgi:hypothetical protein